MIWYREGRNQWFIQMKKKTIKTKYTLRSDGRIVRTEVISGERKYFYGRSDEEVDEKYRQFIQNAGAPVLMKELIEKWWEKKEPEISPNTVSGFKTAEKRLIDAFGSSPVIDMSAHLILDFLMDFQRNGYSQKVISNTRSVLKQVLDLAVFEGLISFNPVSGLPIVKGVKRAVRESASDDDLRKIEQHKLDSLIARMFYFMVYTGLRRGEATALQFKHIDRANSTVTVCQSCAWNNSSRPVLKSPKTEAGHRTVYVPANAMAVIPECDDPEEYVFFPGGLPKRHKMELDLDRYYETSGVNCTPHMLRHKYASMLHSAGIDVKDAQYLLGHSDIAMTQNIYTHLEEAHKKVVGKQFERYAKKLSESVVKKQQMTGNTEH